MSKWFPIHIQTTRTNRVTTTSFFVVEIITVIEFGVNDEAGKDARCGGIKVRTVTTKLSDMAIASFGDSTKSVTLNDLERRNGLILRYFTEFGSFRAHCVKVVEDSFDKFTFASHLLMSFCY